MIKLSFYVPESHLDSVKKALFAAGAGRIGDYDNCCWQVKGEGQFKPLQGSQPFSGTQGIVETVVEYKVEMVCDEKWLFDVIKALKLSHPYEEPAYDAVKLMEL